MGSRSKTSLFEGAKLFTVTKAILSFQSMLKSPLNFYYIHLAPVSNAKRPSTSFTLKPLF